MNLENLKKKVAIFKDDWERSRQCCEIEDFSDDVLSLISIIEQTENKASIDLIYKITLLELQLDQANQTIRAYEAMEKLK